MEIIFIKDIKNDVTFYQAKTLNLVRLRGLEPLRLLDTAT